MHVDATLIVQVLDNLLDNAAKYTPPGTRIFVSAVADGASLRVTVDDEGPGLPRAILRGCSTSFSVVPGKARSSAWGSDLRSAEPLSKPTAARSRRGGRPGGGAQFEFTLPPRSPGHDISDASGSRGRR